MIKDAGRDKIHLTDDHFMRLALEEARKAYQKGEVPVGAIVVVDGTVVGRGHNLRETINNPVAHAEILALQQASQVLKRWRLNDATLYVTLEPCCMCAGGVVLARVRKVIFGCWDPKGGASGSLYDILRDSRLNHQSQVEGGVLEDDCRTLIMQFFEERRSVIS